MQQSRGNTQLQINYVLILAHLMLWDASAKIRDPQARMSMTPRASNNVGQTDFWLIFLAPKKS